MCQQQDHGIVFDSRPSGFTYLLVKSFPLHLAGCFMEDGDSLVAQLIKNPPAMQEIWVRSLCWEDPLEKGKDTHSGILAWRIAWTV